jgi:hypothetical protein
MKPLRARSQRRLRVALTFFAQFLNSAQKAPGLLPCGHCASLKGFVSGLLKSTSGLSTAGAGRQILPSYGFCLGFMMSRHPEDRGAQPMWPRPRVDRTSRLGSTLVRSQSGSRGNKHTKTELVWGVKQTYQSGLDHYVCRPARLDLGLGPAGAAIQISASVLDWSDCNSLPRFSRIGWRKRTPGPPPFSKMN